MAPLLLTICLFEFSAGEVDQTFA